MEDLLTTSNIHKMGAACMSDTPEARKTERMEAAPQTSRGSFRSLAARSLAIVLLVAFAALLAVHRDAHAVRLERLLGGLHELLLPRLYLVRMHLEVLGELGQRAVAANSGEDTFALNEGLWVLRVRLDMGLVGLIVSEQGRNTTP